MERLTKRIKLPNGESTVDFSNEVIHEFTGNHEKGIRALFERVAEYEDTNRTPEQVVEMAKELAELKKQLPPCKVGDTVYYPDNEHYFIAIPIKISEIVIGILDSVQYNGCFFDGNGDPETEFEFNNNDFGKTVFLTKEEAEAKLKEMESE